MKDNNSYFVHESSIIEEGAIIGAGTKIWHFSHVMGTVILGKNCNLGQNIFIGDHVQLGNNVKVQNNVSLYTGVSCADDVFIGPSAVFTNVINPRSAVNRKNQYQTTKIGKGASIGANATIICGCEIGDYAFIGAGAVVTKSIPNYALVVGNPAKQIGWVSEHGHRLNFDAQGKAICPESNIRYQLDQKIVKEIKRDR